MRRPGRLRRRAARASATSSTFVEQASGVDDDTLSQFFARGMLINVVASMDLLDADEAWAKKVLAFCERED